MGPPHSGNRVFDPRVLRLTPDSNPSGDAHNQGVRISILPFGLLLAVTLVGQKSSNSTWQNSCFNNPSAPYCQGRDFAVKPTAPTKDTSGIHGVVKDPGPTMPQGQSATPSVIEAGGIDWRFADPAADALLGFNFSGLAASPLARSLITQLGARQNLSEADLKKIFDGLSGVDQIAVSMRDNRFVVMLTGGVPERTVPSSDPSLKTVPVSGSARLFGSADAVDQAAQRIAAKGPLSELAKSAKERQASSEFWAIGSGGVVGEQAIGAGMKRFWLMVSVRNRLTGDLAFEFNEPPSAKTLQMLAMPGAALEGNVVHARMTMEANEAQQRFGEIVASPLGERLAAVVVGARYLPLRDTTAPKQTKPVIYGLDDGPRVVGQQPNQ